MKTLIFAIAISLAAIFAWHPATWAADTKDQSPASAWLTEFGKAQDMARQQNKPLMIYFSGSDWCPWCQKTSAEILETPEFRDWASKNVVLLNIDFPRIKEQTAAMRQTNQELAMTFEIEGFPTFVFLTSDGTELGRTGYTEGGAKTWLPKAQRILDSQKDLSNAK